MINGRRGCAAVLMLAAGVLTATALLRSAEYDEQYTLLVTAGAPRPDWPTHAITAGDVTAMQSGAADPRTIATALRQTDVHPPLYFWLAAAWRALGLDSLVALRLLSVCFALGSLGLVGVIARRAAIPPSLAMLFTLGCYGFAYTGAIARGFALAELLALAGVAFGLGRPSHPACQGPAGGLTRKPSGGLTRGPAGAPIRGCGLTLGVASAAVGGFAGGVLLGLAVMTNYLASFVAVAAIAGIALHRRAVAGAMTAGFALCLPPVAWLYLAQRDSRPNQFPDFAWWPSLSRLGRYGAANVMGALPLYVAEDLRLCVTAILAGMALLLASLVLLRWQAVATRDARPVLLLCAAAPPTGLLALGVVFHTTPIELRYVSFAAPFIGLLLAGAIGSLRRPWSLTIGTALLSVQTLAICGLMLRPETIQPARAVAAAAEATMPDVVLVPFGNDGVGVVGSFAQEASPRLPIMIVRQPGPEFLARMAPYHRVALALLAQDEASRATVAQVSAILAHPPWRLRSQTGTVAVFEHECSTPQATARPGAADVLRGFHDREVHPPAGDGAGADRRIWAAAGVAAREPSDACDLAPDGAGTGETVHRDLPGPARVRLLIEAAGHN